MSIPNLMMIFVVFVVVIFLIVRSIKNNKNEVVDSAVGAMHSCSRFKRSSRRSFR